MSQKARSQRLRPPKYDAIKSSPLHIVFISDSTSQESTPIYELLARYGAVTLLDAFQPLNEVELTKAMTKATRCFVALQARPDSVIPQWVRIANRLSKEIKFIRVLGNWCEGVRVNQNEISGVQTIHSRELSETIRHYFSESAPDSKGRDGKQKAVQKMGSATIVSLAETTDPVVSMPRANNPNPAPLVEHELAKLAWELPRLTGNVALVSNCIDSCDATQLALETMGCRVAVRRIIRLNDDRLETLVTTVLNPVREVQLLCVLLDGQASVPALKRWISDHQYERVPMLFLLGFCRDPDLLLKQLPQLVQVLPRPHSYASLHHACKEALLKSAVCDASL